MRKLICYTLLMLFLISCRQNESDLYKRDKYHIEHAFLSNVEAVRRLMSNHVEGAEWEDLYTGLPDSLPEYDGGDYFRYVFHRDELTRKYWARETPVCEWLDVRVENISYSLDSLKCVALCTVCDMYGIDSEYDVAYDCYAISGIRESKSDPFKIYIMPYMQLLHIKTTRNVAAAELKHQYFMSIKGGYGTAPNGPYKYGINNPKFFETAGDFSYIDSLNLYWTQTVGTVAKRRPSFYYSNQDSTITKYLCPGKATNNNGIMILI